MSIMSFVSLYSFQIVIGVFALICACMLAFFFTRDSDDIAKSALTWIACLLVAMLITVGFFCLRTWNLNNTATGARIVKDVESEYLNGINREITITAEDGREIFHYEGKCDIETDNYEYILFEDEEGLRHIIYKGALDTMIISEIGD